MFVDLLTYVFSLSLILFPSKNSYDFHKDIKCEIHEKINIKSVYSYRYNNFCSFDILTFRLMHVSTFSLFDQSWDHLTELLTLRSVNEFSQENCLSLILALARSNKTVALLSFSLNTIKKECWSTAREIWTHRSPLDAPDGGRLDEGSKALSRTLEILLE